LQGTLFMALVYLWLFIFYKQHFWFHGHCKAA
jgi:hypothetical protein